MALSVFTLALTLFLGGDDLRTSAGAPLSLPELLARGPVVLVFWNSWLPRANEFAKLLPEIEAAAEQHGWSGAVVVFQERRSDAEHDVPRLAGPLPYAFDRRGDLLRRFQVTRAPAVLLVERNGAVRARCGPDPAAVHAIIREMAHR